MALGISTSVYSQKYINTDKNDKTFKDWSVPGAAKRQLTSKFSDRAFKITLNMRCRSSSQMKTIGGQTSDRRYFAQRCSDECERHRNENPQLYKGVEDPTNSFGFTIYSDRVFQSVKGEKTTSAWENKYCFCDRIHSCNLVPDSQIQSKQVSTIMHFQPQTGNHQQTRLISQTSNWGAPCFKPAATAKESRDGTTVIPIAMRPLITGKLQKFPAMGWKLRKSEDVMVDCVKAQRVYETFAEALRACKSESCKGIIDQSGKVCNDPSNSGKTTLSGFTDPEGAQYRICLQEMYPSKNARCNMRPGSTKSWVASSQRQKYALTVDECAAWVERSQVDNADFKADYFTNDKYNYFKMGNLTYNNFPSRGWRYGKCQGNEFIFTPDTNMELSCQCRSVDAKPNQKCENIEIDAKYDKNINKNNRIRSYLYTDTNLEVVNRCGAQNANVLFKRVGANYLKRNPSEALSKFISAFATRMEETNQWDSRSKTGDYYIHMNTQTYDAYVVDSCKNVSGTYRNHLQTRKNSNMTVLLPSMQSPRVIAEGAYRCSNGMYTLASHHKTPLACGLEVAHDSNCNKRQPIFSHGQFEGEYYCRCFPASKSFCGGFENHPKTDGQAIFKMYDLSTKSTVTKIVGRCQNTKVTHQVGTGYRSIDECAVDVLKDENCAASVNYSNPLGDFAWGAGKDGTNTCECYTEDLDEHLGFNSRNKNNGCNFGAKTNPSWAMYRAQYIENPTPIILTGHEACVDDTDMSINNDTDRIAAYFKAPKFCLHSDDDTTDNVKRDRCLMVQSYCLSTGKIGDTRTRGCAGMLAMSPCGDIGSSCFVENCLAFLDKLTFSETTRCNNEPLGKDLVFNGKKQGLINSIVNNGKNCIPVSRFFSKEDES